MPYEEIKSPPLETNPPLRLLVCEELMNHMYPRAINIVEGQDILQTIQSYLEPTTSEVETFECRATTLIQSWKKRLEVIKTFVNNRG